MRCLWLPIHTHTHFNIHINISNKLLKVSIQLNIFPESRGNIYKLEPQICLCILSIILTYLIKGTSPTWTASWHFDHVIGACIYDRLRYVSSEWMDVYIINIYTVIWRIHTYIYICMRVRDTWHRMRGSDVHERRRLDKGRIHPFIPHD